MTLRLTETRGSRVWPAFVHASRNSSICSAWSSVERHLRVLEQEGGAHQVQALLARPDGGLARARAPPDPVGEAGRLRLHRQHRLAWAAAAIGADDAGAGDRGAEERRLLARIVGVDRVAEGLGTVPGRLGRAAADAELEPATGEQVCRRRRLGHVERVLVAHVDHAGADLDPRRLDADRREERERRGELSCEMVDTDERPVDPDLLRRDRELDGLAERVAAGVRQPAAGMPGAEREEADLFGSGHRFNPLFTTLLIKQGSPDDEHSLQERRGRDLGVAADPVDDECHLVDVAPAPVFAWLELNG